FGDSATIATTDSGTGTTTAAARPVNTFATRTDVGE
ncbi:hypothetical protein SOVF_122970, partial [Spinacia oleracea]